MAALHVLSLFFITIILVLISIEGGFRLGKIIFRLKFPEKESPVSAIAGSILGLLAFMLAFTFGMVSNRYDTRKALVRDEANAIGTALLRTEFLPDPDQHTAKKLLHDYLDLRIAAAQSGKMNDIEGKIIHSEKIHRQLWLSAAENGKKDMNSDVAALYIESINTLINNNTLRVSVSMHAPMPTAMWFVLYSLLIMGMATLGYQTAIAGSGRSVAILMLAISFSLIIVLIAGLDRPQMGVIPVPQQPLIDLRKSINETL